MIHSFGYYFFGYYTHSFGLHIHGLANKRRRSTSKSATTLTRELAWAATTHVAMKIATAFCLKRFPKKNPIPCTVHQYTHPQPRPSSSSSHTISLPFATQQPVCAQRPPLHPSHIILKPITQRPHPKTQTIITIDMLSPHSQ